MTRLWSFLLLLCLAVSAFAIDSESFEDPALRARYEYLTHILRCPKCQGETIAESNAGIAVDLRREVRRMLSEGKSDAEILDFMTARFGDFVLYKPPFSTRTFVLWFAPVMILGGALIIALVVIRKRTQQSFDDPPGSDASATEGNKVDAT